MSQRVNRKIEELKKKNYNIKPQNLPRFKNPYLLKLSVQALNDIYNKRGDGIATAQNPPIGNMNYQNQRPRQRIPNGNRNLTTGERMESSAGSLNNRNHPLSRPNARNP
jgi:hypothetical protein